MDFILKAKHWQVFLILFLSSFLLNFTFEGESGITTIIRITGLIIFFGWILLLGHTLYNYLPTKVEMSYNFFVINFLLVAGAMIAVVFLNNQFHFEGVVALPFFYLFYAAYHVISFPGRVVKAIELGKETDFGDNIGMFFLLFFWPIGIWFIQPRINKVIESEVDTQDSI